ncbi:hypothetical protein HYU50_00715 [Candidatus Woesearchaeota archaeon]|nr:hypothetical protein [Candidatus Woesearchaeota archaeon]
MGRKNRFLLIGIILILIQGVIAISDNNPSNNVINITVNVVETENVSIYYVPVDDITKSEFNDAKINLTNFFNNTYPVSDNGLVVGQAETNINVKQGILNEEDRVSLLLDIQEKAIQAGFKYGVGIVRKNWIQDRTDLSPDTTGFTHGRVTYPAIVESEQTKTMAHEIGHKKPFNLCEEYSFTLWDRQDNDGTYCPNAVNTSAGRKLNSTCFANSGCPTTTIPKLYNFGDINETSELRNFMGSSDDPDSKEFEDSLFFQSWISRDTYKVLLKELNETGEEEEKDSCLIVSAIFDIFGTITANPFYILTSGTLCEFFESEGGEFSVRTFDNQSSLRQNISFNLEFAEYADGGNITPLNTTFAIFAIPFNESVKTINFFQNETLKSQRNVTPNTPTINITTQLQNQVFDKSLTISWNASDLDNDTINYAVLISSDNGNTFSTLEIDYSNKSLIINSTNFINSNQYKIKILATDGINTGNDTTEIFSIYHDQNKFAIKNSSGANIAWFGDAGNIVIKGKLEQNSNFQATDNFAFKIRNNLNDVLIIENNGSMYIDGTLAENQAVITSDINRNNFVVKNSGALVANVNETGYVFLKGTITQNGNP